MFVDDAVRGTLPGVCAKDGVPTTSGLTVHDELGDRAGLGVAWLLLLAGPPGWLGLLIISASRGGRREVLTVQIPLSDEAYQRLRSARRGQSIALAVAVLAAPVALFTLLAFTTPLVKAVALMALVVTVIAVVALIANERRLRDARICVGLDASRRWVTLVGVHPAFVAACQAHDARQGQRT